MAAGRCRSAFIGGTGRLKSSRSSSSANHSDSIEVCRCFAWPRPAHLPYMRSKGSAWTVLEWEDRGGLDKCLHTMLTIAAEARCRIHDNDWFLCCHPGLQGPPLQGQRRQSLYVPDRTLEGSQPLPLSRPRSHSSASCRAERVSLKLPLFALWFPGSLGRSHRDQSDDIWLGEFCA